MNKQKNKKKQRSHRFKIHPFAIAMIPFAIPVVFLAVEIVKSQTKRITIESNYVETIGYVSRVHEATGNGKQIRIDYYFCTKDSNAHGSGFPAYKIAKKLEIGDRILIHYERGNPGNNMYYDTVPLDYIPHRIQ